MLSYTTNSSTDASSWKYPMYGNRYGCMIASFMRLEAAPAPAVRRGRQCARRSPAADPVRWQAQDPFGDVGGDGKIGAVGGGQRAIHREVRDQRVEVPPRPDAVAVEQVVELVPGHRVAPVEQDREVGVVRHALAGRRPQEPDAAHAGEPLAVQRVDRPAPLEDAVE